MQRQRHSERFTALVVDDEPLAREGLRMLLAEDRTFVAIGQAKNGSEAVATIRADKPDVVFLDVQMPELDGLAVVREVGAANMPAVIFVTAFDRYAIQAFEINAIDYLLKPVTRERFALALQRAKARIPSPEDTQRQILALLQSIAPSRQQLQRLAVRSAGKTSFVDLDDIHWIQAAENYVQLHTASGRQLLHVPLSTLEASLDPEMFLRIHRSLIVNVRQIKEFEPAFHGEYVLLLHCGARLQSSRRYRERISRWAANPF